MPNATIDDVQAYQYWLAADKNYHAAARAANVDHAVIMKRVKRYMANINKEAPTPQTPTNDLTQRIVSILQRGRHTLDALAQQLSISRGAALDNCDSLSKQGYNVVVSADGHYSIDKSISPPDAPHLNPDSLPVYISRHDNTFLFGAVSDNHISNKHARLDVLNDLYNKFFARGVDRVFNGGNWIDGEARFNKHELLAHGVDGQCEMLANQYPQRPGITTYAIAGDDHEGWYTQREGMNIGRYAESVMRNAGRADWVDCGYMECHFKLVNANTGAFSILSLVHAGGGSAYALSYSIQKIIESLEGGEKPAVAIYGHYHKLWAGNIRNVWCLQPGCTEDQTSFMRKRRISAHVGGALVGLEQDPETGAIVSFTPTMYRYFNKGYYNDRWSNSGQVTLPERAINVTGETFTGEHREDA